MSFLNQVELSVYKPNTQRSPIARRREKLAFKLEEQLKLAIDSTYQPTKIVWNTDSDGNQHKVEQPKRIKRWWIERDDGSVQLTVRYGSKPLEFAKGKNAIALRAKRMWNLLFASSSWLYWVASLMRCWRNRLVL